MLCDEFIRLIARLRLIAQVYSNIFAEGCKMMMEQKFINSVIWNYFVLKIIASRGKVSAEVNTFILKFSLKGSLVMKFLHFAKLFKMTPSPRPTLSITKVTTSAISATNRLHPPFNLYQYSINFTWVAELLFKHFQIMQHCKFLSAMFTLQWSKCPRRTAACPCHAHGSFHWVQSWSFLVGRALAFQTLQWWIREARRGASWLGTLLSCCHFLASLGRWMQRGGVPTLANHKRWLSLTRWTRCSGRRWVRMQRIWSWVGRNGMKWEQI